MTLPAGKARVGGRARIQSQAGARLRRSHTNQTVRTVRDSTKKIVWKEEDDQAWETVSEPGGVDQQLLLVCHSKDEAEREGDQQPGGGTVGGQVTIFLR